MQKLLQEYEEDEIYYTQYLDNFVIHIKPAGKYANLNDKQLSDMNLQ